MPGAPCAATPAPADRRTERRFTESAADGDDRRADATRRSRLVWRNTRRRLEFHPAELRRLRGAHHGAGRVLFYVASPSWNVFGVRRVDRPGQLPASCGTTRRFWTALRNTLYYTVFHIPLTLAASLGLALLLNRKLRGVAFFRTAAFFPYITSIVALAMVWNLLFSPEYGPINAFLRAVGVDDPPGWTTSSTWSMPAVIIVGTWREMGYYMLLFLAGLQTIPAQLYEAAQIDGAYAWQRFRHVTLPGLGHTTFFVTVMLTIGSFKVFDLILLMTDGGPGQSHAGAVAVHLPEGLRGEPVRLRLGGLDRAVRHLLRRHGHPVHGQQAEGPLMTDDLSMPPPAGRRARRPRDARPIGQPGWRLARVRRPRGRGGRLLLPFYWMVVSSLKTNNDVFTIPINGCPDPVVWQNYLDIWQRSDMTTWLRQHPAAVGGRHPPAGPDRQLRRLRLRQGPLPRPRRALPRLRRRRSRCPGSRT